MQAGLREQSGDQGQRAVGHRHCPWAWSGRTRRESSWRMQAGSSRIDAPPSLLAFQSPASASHWPDPAGMQRPSSPVDGAHWAQTPGHRTWQRKPLITSNMCVHDVHRPQSGALSHFLIQWHWPRTPRPSSFALCCSCLVTSCSSLFFSSSLYWEFPLDPSSSWFNPTLRHLRTCLLFSCLLISFPIHTSLQRPHQWPCCLSPSSGPQWYAI